MHRIVLHRNADPACDLAFRGGLAACAGEQVAFVQLDGLYRWLLLFSGRSPVQLRHGAAERCGSDACQQFLKHGTASLIRHGELTHTPCATFHDQGEGVGLL